MEGLTHLLGRVSPPWSNSWCLGNVPLPANVWLLPSWEALVFIVVYWYRPPWVLGRDGTRFLFDPLQVSSLQVEILSVRLAVWRSVITSYYFPYSDSKLTQHPPVDLSHATSPTVSNAPHPCPPCPPVNWSPFPFNSSPNEQDHISNWGRVQCQLDIFIIGVKLYCSVMGKTRTIFITKVWFKTNWQFGNLT